MNIYYFRRDKTVVLGVIPATIFGRKISAAKFVE